MRNNSSCTITGLQKVIIEYCWNLFIIWQALKEYRSFQRTKEIIKKLKALKKHIAGDQLIHKIIKANGRYYWNMHIPGFPSKVLSRHILGEMNRIHPVTSKHLRLSVLFIGITKKCPLKCLHCYEWQELNKKEKLSLSDLQHIIKTFQKTGVGHIQFGGGEPMMRFEDMVELIRVAKDSSDIWISTSGLNLTKEKAFELKEAGLTGAAISLDHFEPDFHNAFRGNAQAFEWAMQATNYCRQAGLITCWSLCATREFISRENLLQYAVAAKRSKVYYIQLFEPVAVGRFYGKDVTLNAKQIKILEDFYQEMNTDSKYRDFPLVVYIGYYQRRIGCLGSGNRYIYVDTDGNIQPCPFCRTKKKIPVENQSAEDLLESIRTETCPVYKKTVDF